MVPSIKKVFTLYKKISEEMRMLQIPEKIRKKLNALLEETTSKEHLNLYLVEDIDEAIEYVFAMFRTAQPYGFDQSVEEVASSVTIDELEYHKYLKYCERKNMDISDEYNEFRFVMLQILEEYKLKNILNGKEQPVMM